MLDGKKVEEPYFFFKKLINQKGFEDDGIAFEIGCSLEDFEKKINRVHGCDFTLSEAVMLGILLNESIDNYVVEKKL